jgi:hypothetical protein
MIDSFKILGTTEDVTSCECCGRENLKKTVAISLDDADPMYFGTTCAARAVGWAAADMRRSIKRVEDEQKEKARLARNARIVAEQCAWFTWLDAHAPNINSTFEQIQSLGGYQAARAAFYRDKEQAG